MAHWHWSLAVGRAAQTTPSSIARTTDLHEYNLKIGAPGRNYQSKWSGFCALYPCASEEGRDEVEASRPNIFSVSLREAALRGSVTSRFHRFQHALPYFSAIRTSSSRRLADERAAHKQSIESDMECCTSLPSSLAVPVAIARNRAALLRARYIAQGPLVDDECKCNENVMKQPIRVLFVRYSQLGRRDQRRSSASSRGMVIKKTGQDGSYRPVCERLVKRYTSVGAMLAHVVSRLAVDADHLHRLHLTGLHPLSQITRATRTRCRPVPRARVDLTTFKVAVVIVCMMGTTVNTVVRKLGLHQRRRQGSMRRTAAGSLFLDFVSPHMIRMPPERVGQLVSNPPSQFWGIPSE
ncbi:hypothetical protein C8R46DRAFT_1327224 [Mycena filopes]|nr:hypothetical protein C8R46DRAFT_1327224 [Mycena filopes]